MGRLQTVWKNGNTAHFEAMFDATAKIDKGAKLFKLSVRKNDNGFTLIELMVVIAIIGILAAIAIPQFASYRTRSFNTAAVASIRSFSTAQEAYYVDNRSYTTSLDLLKNQYGAQTSKDVTITIGSASDTAYIIRSSHSKGDLTYVVEGPGGRVNTL